MASLLRHSAIRYFATAPLKFKTPSAVSGGHEGGYKMWKNLSLFVAFPVIGLVMVNCYLEETKGHHEPPPFVAYEHLRIRNKRFPWGEGQKSLFHNPHANPLPTGYEEH